MNPLQVIEQGDVVLWASCYCIYRPARVSRTVGVLGVITVRLSVGTRVSSCAPVASFPGHTSWERGYNGAMSLCAPATVSDLMIL